MTNFRMLIVLIILVLLSGYVFWNSGKEALFSGSGNFEANSSGFGPVLSVFKLTLPEISLKRPAQYSYQFSRFFSNKTTWVSFYIKGINKENFYRLPVVELIVKDDKTVLFHEKASLNSEKFWKTTSEMDWRISPFELSNLEMSWDKNYHVELFISNGSIESELVTASVVFSSSWK